MKNVYVVILVVLISSHTVYGQAKVMFTKNIDLITQVMDQQSTTVAKWMLANLTQAQVTSFETTFFPPLTDAQKLQAAKIERNMVELQGKDSTAITAEIEALEPVAVVAESVK